MSNKIFVPGDLIVINNQIHMLFIIPAEDDPKIYLAYCRQSVNQKELDDDPQKNYSVDSWEQGFEQGNEPCPTCVKYWNQCL